MDPNNDFLPQEYEVPSSNGNYAKLEKGENRFRILSKPIIGWLDWKDKKPLRFAFNAKPEKAVDASKPIKHFWAFVVWNYKLEQIQVLEITQKGLQNGIAALNKDPDWGSPFKYDIKIDRTGDDKNNTEYALKPVPHKEVSDAVKEAYLAKPCNLQKLFTGDDPFGDAPQQQSQTSAPPPVVDKPIETAAPVVVADPNAKPKDLPF